MSTMILPFYAGHLSQQFSDPAGAHQRDAKTLFKFAVAHSLRVVGGTEAADPSVWEPLRTEAEAAGYVIRRHESCWVAVQRHKIVGMKSVDSGYIEVVKTNEGQSQHDHGSRGIAWMQWEDEDFGTVTYGVMHQLTQGRRPGEPNYRLNKRFGAAASDFAKKFGAGAMICFLAGDMNMSDKNLDVFHGAPFTSAMDELQEWPDTHKVGPIDTVGSFDGDRRVTWETVTVYNDAKVYFHDDHYLLVVVANIRAVRH